MTSSCPLCSLPRGYSECFYSHVAVNLKNKKSKYTCKMCGYRPTSLNIQLILFHIRAHTGERPFACRYCTYRAARKAMLRVHTARKHPESSGESSGDSKINFLSFGKWSTGHAGTTGNSQVSYDDGDESCTMCGITRI